MLIAQTYIIIYTEIIKIKAKTIINNQSINICVTLKHKYNKYDSNKHSHYVCDQILA